MTETTKEYKGFLYGDSPTEDQSTRFHNDQKLRKKGFKILQRKQGAEPVWIRKGVEYKESEAVARFLL